MEWFPHELAVVVVFSAIIGLTFISLFVVMFGEDWIYDRFKSVAKLVNPPKKSEPKIAYKKAHMLPGGDHFSGVIGHHYSADDSTRGRGFHAYEDLDQAINHPQEGNVLLEVLLSGHIEELELGYVAEKQRVLQVIPYKCYILGCDGTPSYFLHEKDKELSFICPIHSLEAKAFNKAGRFVSNLPFLREYAPKPYVVAPLDKLSLRFPWLDKHKIVVGRLQGPKSFIPTEIKS